MDLTDNPPKDTDYDPSTYLKGRLLVATPSMNDPRFHRAVIFICAHDEHGAMGLTINNTLPGVAFNQMINHFEIDPDTSDDLEKTAVLGGGPVETARGFVLHPASFRLDDTILINDDYGVTGTIDALKAIASGDGPEQFLFMLGYAGWTAGQLDQEVQQNSWLIATPDDSLLFNTEAEQKWKSALARLGIEPGFLSGQAGRA
mgnify:CR=1 FL=1